MPTSHPSMFLLALSKAALLCPGHPDTADGSSSFWFTRQTIPSNTGDSLPSLSPAPSPAPSPAVMQKGCLCPQVPQGWRVALPGPGFSESLRAGGGEGVQGQNSQLGKGLAGLR